MVRAINDQAEGLRRILQSDSVPVIAVTSGSNGMGKTTAVVNLAVALAMAGRRVLILDENQDGNNAGAQLGLKARYDLLDFLKGEKSLDQIVLRGPAGVALVAARRAREALPYCRLDERMLARRLKQISGLADVILMDSAFGGSGAPATRILAPRDVIVVLTPTASSITDAYAAIKAMNMNHARRDFGVLINHADSETAQVVFGNIARVARRHLAVAIDYWGFIPPDGQLPSSAWRKRALVADQPTADAAGGFRRLAAEIESRMLGNESREHQSNVTQRAPAGGASL